MENITYKKNAVIFNEGDAEYCMYDVRYGSVGIYSDYGKPEQKLLKVLEADSFFGEIAMFERSARTATAVAMEKTVLVKITEDVFTDYFNDKPAKIMQIMINTSGRLRELTRQHLGACAALSDYVRAKENGEKISPELLAKLKKYAGK